MPGRQHRLVAGAAVIGAALYGGTLRAAEDTAGQQFRDNFAAGKTELTWRPLSLYSDGVVEGRPVGDAPDGDGGIGVLRDQGGGPGAVSYAETAKAEDSFVLAAQVYCPLAGDERDGALTGLVFFVDPGRSDDPEAGGFYRLVCDYRFGDAALSFAYVGPNIGRQPLELERWRLVEQPVPTDPAPGWHRLEVWVEQGLIDIYLDDGKLNQRPLPAEHVITDIANLDAGYAGVYASHLGAAPASPIAIAIAVPIPEPAPVTRAF